MYAFNRISSNRKKLKKKTIKKGEKKKNYNFNFVNPQHAKPLEFI